MHASSKSGGQHVRRTQQYNHGLMARQSFHNSCINSLAPAPVSTFSSLMLFGVGTRQAVQSFHNTTYKKIQHKWRTYGSKSAIKTRKRLLIKGISLLGGIAVAAGMSCQPQYSYCLSDSLQARAQGTDAEGVPTAAAVISTEKDTEKDAADDDADTDKAALYEAADANADMMMGMLDKLLPHAQFLTVGSLSGYFAGYAVKQVGRMAALPIGLFVIGLQIANYNGWVAQKFFDDIKKLFDSNGDGKIDGQDIKHYIKMFFKMLTFGVVGAGGMAAGFFYGFRHG